VTYTCPLTCAHCCFESSPRNRDRLEPALVVDTIRALDASTIKHITFTGGEPFLLGKNLPDFIRVSHDRGFGTRVVTSAYFGTTPEAARKRIAEVVDAGLDEVSISWDDFHEAFVRFQTVKNVLIALKQFPAVAVAINIVQARESRWNVARLRAELGPDLADVKLVVESPLNLTGRAGTELSDGELRSKRAIGPCPYVLTGPTLSAKGRLLACCGVIPDTDALCINPVASPATLNDDLERARNSVLYTWLYLRGPYDIMEWIAQRFDVLIPRKDSVGGNCQACRHLFELPEELIERAMREKAPEILSEFRLLESLGVAEPTDVLALWHHYLPQEEAIYGTWVAESPNSLA
jgi:organic radical activating enzyme